MPGPMKEYKNLTNGEHMVKIEKELSKGIDPCEKGMECKQDREIRKPEEKEETEEKELNWKHEDLVPEAPDPISIPDTNNIPKIPHDQTKTNDVEQMNKLKAQKKENEKEEVKELQEQMEQLKLLEAQGKTYDPEEVLRQSIKTPGKNPVDIVRIVRLLKDTENEEIPAWQIKQQQKVKSFIENHREKDETPTWQKTQQHKISQCLETKEWEDWELIQENKIRQCMEEQFKAEEEKKTRHMEEKEKSKEKEKLPEPSDPEVIQHQEPEAPTTDNTEKAVANTYNLGIGRVTPARESLIALEPEVMSHEKVMSILTNPTYYKDDID